MSRRRESAPVEDVTAIGPPPSNQSRRKLTASSDRRPTLMRRVCEGLSCWKFIPSIVDKSSFRNDLLDQIEFLSIGSQYRQPRFRGRQIDQGVVEALLPLVRLETLDPGQRTRHQAGIRPDLVVGIQQPRRWDVVENLDVVISNGRPAARRRVGIGDPGRKFAETN